MGSIDSRAWLAEHQPVGNFGAIEVGQMALASHRSNVWVAMHLEPELRLEIVLACLAEAGDSEVTQRRIRQISEFIDARDEAAQPDA